MKCKALFTLALTSALLPAALRADEPSKWSFDASLYGLAAGMSGNAGIGPVDANVDTDFDQLWNHLKFGAMGTVRVGYDKWSLWTDVIYMDLKANAGPITAEAEQWMVQPALEYRFNQYLAAYAGTRYNNLDLSLDGPFRFNPSGTHEWWDPTVGARVSLPLGHKFSFNVSGDVGGVEWGGNDFTWQVYPFFSWQFTQWGSVQAGYRLLYTDYETGSGFQHFKYDMLTAGPQIGFTFHF